MTKWLTTLEVANFEKTTERTIRNKIERGELEYKTEYFNGGFKRHLINPNTMSPKAQKAYTEELVAASSVKNSKPDPPQVKRSIPDPEVEVLFKIRQTYGEEKFAEVVKKQMLVRQVLDIKKSSIKNKTIVISEFAQNAGVTLSTLYRWIDLWLQYGPDGLVHGNMMHKLCRKNTAYKSFDELAVVYLRNIYLSDRQYSVGECYRFTLDEAKKQGWNVGSYQTACRIIQDIPQEDKDFFRKGEEYWKSHHMPRALRADPEYNNEVWEGDHTRMDFFVNYEGKPLRLWLTIWVDARSRCVVGWCISTQANAETIGLALRYAILPKQDSPIYGVPQYVLIDNGQDFISKRILGERNPEFAKEMESLHLQGLFSKLGIIGRRCAIHNGAAKGRVERKFEDIKDKFYREHPAWCGADPKERPEGFDEKKLLKEGKLPSFEQVVKDFKDFIDKLNNNYHSEIDMTPMEKYMQGKRWKEEVPSPRTLDMWLLPGEARIVHNVGIMFKSKVYDDPIKLSGYSKEQVSIFYDPADMSQIFAFNEQGEYIGDLPLKERRAYITSDEEMYKHIGQQKKRKSMVKDRKAEDNELLQEAGIPVKVGKRTHKAATGENNEPAKIVQLSKDETTAKEISKARSRKPEQKKPDKPNLHDEYVRRRSEPIIQEMKKMNLI